VISNRKQIENFCNDRNIKIHSLEYIRNHEYIYGDSFDSSYWELSIFLTESTISTYDTTLGDTIADGIKLMFEAIQCDMNNL
jgi:hypothetical protein